MPQDVGFGLGPYVTHRCLPGDATCADEFPLHVGGNTWGSTLWLRRWQHDESRRHIAEGDDPEQINAAFDQLVASIGKPPGRPLLSAGLSAGDSNKLEIELRAPAICETYWGRYGGARQSIQVEWDVRGGVAPYRVQFADRMLEGDEGTIWAPCGVQRDDADGVDSQLMNTQAVVIDADGTVASAVVSTYVIASNRFGGSELLGGWTYRVQGLLVTIPDGLTFDVQYFGHTHVDCDPDEEEEEEEEEAALPGASSSWTISDHTYLYRCQNRWSMSGEWRVGNLSGPIWVEFGETTDDLIDHGVRLDEASEGAPGAQRALANIERRVEALADSVGKPPVLPDHGVYNPAALRLRAWPEPLVCGPVNSWDQSRSATAQRRVAGGYWWPLGVGDEAWNTDLHSARVICGAEWGSYSNTLETHEIGPNPATAEAVVTHYAVPMIGDHDALFVQPSNWPTSYCEPGGVRAISWNVQLGTAPYHARVNGVSAQVTHNEELDWGSGWHEVTCANRLGLQAMTIEVWDSAERPTGLCSPSCSWPSSSTLRVDPGPTLSRPTSRTTFPVPRLTSDSVVWPQRRSVFGPVIHRPTSTPGPLNQWGAGVSADLFNVR